MQSDGNEPGVESRQDGQCNSAEGSVDEHAAIGDGLREQIAERTDADESQWHADEGDEHGLKENFDHTRHNLLDAFFDIRHDPDG